MFNLKPKAKPHELDNAIESLILELAGTEETDEKYSTVVTSLKTLMELRIADRTANRKPAMSPDVIGAVAGNLLGILSILHYEKAEIVTSKALGFVRKI